MNIALAKRLRRIAAFALSLALLTSAFLPALAQENSDRPAKEKFAQYVPGQLIVKFKENQAPDNTFLAEHNLRSANRILREKRSGDAAETKKSGTNRIYLAEENNSSDTELAIAQLKNDPRVEYAEPNYMITVDTTPNDPSFASLWGMDNTGQTGGTPNADINTPEAWSIQTGNSSIVVGVIDTGIDYNHPDLAANIWTNPGEIANNGIDDDGNGYIDDIHGWNFVNNSSDPFDDYGHGTHVAGTIGASGNNGVGVAGVNWSIKMAALKFIGANGSGTTTDAISAINYANAMGFKITNNSWGGGGYSQALYDAIRAANTNGNLFVAAAGNSGANIDTRPSYPASYNLPNIISVAATDHNDLKASFSNYGAISVDLGAPGVNIYSTVPTGNCPLCDASGYASYNGTSMASPHVAGVAALVMAQFPTFDAAGVKARILNYADPIASLKGKTLTGGRLNAYAALFTDLVPPSTITDLAVSGTSYNSAALSWTAPSDNNITGKAAAYDIRYSSSAIITDSDWTSASQALGEPAPKTSGSPENFTVSGLSSETTYYFAIRSTDGAGNVSAISNIASAATTAAPITDVVTIIKATYSKNGRELTVEATSSQQPSPTLTVRGFGTMVYNPSSSTYQFKKRPVNRPSSVTVDSSLGGTATKTVSIIR